ncbi:MAG: SDR family oxidoreductase [Gemmatimonadetes bacterium]|nr:SDR family oxidoreductase [Gemmatimonadota bacterium]
MPLPLLSVRPLGDYVRALVLGAKSAIAQAIVERLDGYDFALAARECSALEPFAADLRLRHSCEVELFEFDALDFAALARLPEQVHERGGPFDLVVLAFGYLGDERAAQRDTDELAHILNANFTGAAIALAHLANYLEERDTPTGIIAISSVAGDRGRQGNYAYGSAKGGLSIFLQGLRHRLAATSVHVLTVKPGFVYTPMSEGLDGLFLVVPPERVAADIVRAYRQKKNVLYTPFFWRWIMLVIKSIPERIFKRLKL